MPLEGFLKTCKGSARGVYKTFKRHLHGLSKVWMHVKGLQGPAIWHFREPPSYKALLRREEGPTKVGLVPCHFALWRAIL